MTPNLEPVPHPERRGVGGTRLNAGYPGYAEAYGLD